MVCKRDSLWVLRLIAGIVLLCPFYGPSAKGDVNLVELAKKIRPSVVLIQTFDKDKKPLRRGSGFFIDKKGHLITNYHVLKGAYSAEVKTFDGRMYPVKLVLAERQEVDLIKVLVDIHEKAVKFVQVTKTVPEVAERVLVVGSPLGLEQTVSEGIVSAVREIPTIGKIFQISAPISPGSSGSPVLNMKGEVIGVASFQLIEGQNLNFAVSGENVLALKPEKKGKALKEWTSDAIKKRTRAAESFFQKGIRFSWTGEYEKAVAQFEKAIEQDKNFEKTYFHMGLAYFELGRYEEAAEILEQDPHFTFFTYHNLGTAYSRLGRYEKAIKAYKQAIRLNPLGLTYRNLGLDYASLGCYRKAVDAFKQAIELEPNSVENYDSLGATYATFGRYEKAVEAYKQAIRIKPDYVDAHCGLGATYGVLRRYREAVEAFKQAIRIKPDYAVAHYSLGLTYLWSGDKGSALEEFKILKALDKDLANQLFNLIYK